MANRFRTRTTGRVMGQLNNNGVISYDNVSVASEEYCEDTVSSGDNWDFYTKKTVRSGAEINTSGPGDVQFQNYRCTGLGAITRIAAFPGQKPNGTYATEAVARTNPSAPYVDVPVALLELGDAAQLIKKQGDNLIKLFAGKYIEAEFFWKPLISDLEKLTRFHDAVARRTKVMNKLRNHGGFRTTVSCDTLSVTNSISWRPQTLGETFPRRNVDVMGTRDIWAHVRWRPTYEIKDLSDREAVALVKRSLLGMTIDASTAWELIPFSWLVDWGWNIGAFLKANRNMIPALLDEVSIMEHTVTTASTPSITEGNHALSAGSVLYEEKQRRPTAAFPVAHFPFLTGSQMGIVSALSVMRM